MDRLDDRVIADFLRRSYFAVDGLWFVKAEEERSFEAALGLDEQVWRVMPKIQARKARELLGVEGHGIADLIRCFGLKLAAEGYEYEVRRPSDHEAEVVVTYCPWYAVLQRTRRESVAAVIADRICSSEFACWAKEFSQDIELSIRERLCSGGRKCRIRFTEP